ncbi:MAG TPA: hypothetical protein VFH73_11305 [Polyangia bacterium]|nr:hypothetical protein [Polyangia bacterium]
MSGIVLAAAPAWACPACVGKSQVLPPALKLVGLFLLVPFVLSAITMLVVRRLNKNV